MTRPRCTLEFRPAALRQLRKLDQQVARRVKAAIEALRMDPRPHSTKALSGQHGWLSGQHGWLCVRVGD